MWVWVWLMQSGGLVGAEFTGRSPGWKGAFRDSGGVGAGEKMSTCRRQVPLRLWKEEGEGNGVTRPLCASRHSTRTSRHSGSRPEGGGNSTYRGPRKTRQ